MPKPFVLIPIITPVIAACSYIIAGYSIYDLAVCHDRSLLIIQAISPFTSEYVNATTPWIQKRCIISSISRILPHF